MDKIASLFTEEKSESNRLKLLMEFSERTFVRAASVSTDAISFLLITSVTETSSLM